MTPRSRMCLAPLTLIAALALAGCGDPPPNEPAAALAPQNGIDPAGTDALESTDPDALSGVYDGTELPYPVYPNGSKYRVGGENGLKIVVFQTEDDFAAVDEYYRDAIGDAGMPRLMAMNDYVRYSQSETDEDPWATYRPGIVIHQFSDESERQAVGAKSSAKTNIIMSF